MRPSRTTWQLWALALLSLAVRLAYCPYTRFGEDEAAIYDRGLDLYLQHTLPTTGARVVYSGTMLPGSLQPLLTGLPLFLSGGMPSGAAAAVALLNLAAMAVTLAVCRRLFPQFHPVALGALVLFAPWSIGYTYIWNPSYTPLFSALFLYGLVRQFETPGDARGAFLVGYAVLSLLQLHLSVALLLALLGLTLLFGWIRRVHWAALAAGVLVGGITLVPYLLQGAVTQPGTPNAFVSGNVVLDLGNARDLFRILPRFLSFATGETTHVIGPGLPRTLRGFALHPWLWPFLGFGIAGSAVLWLLGLGFYLSPRRLALWPRLRTLSTTERVDLLVWLLPFVAAALFVFSIRSAGEHTYWMVVPFAFLPLLRTLAERERLPFTPQVRWVLLAVYVFSTTLYTTVGTALVQRKGTIHEAERVAHKNFPNQPRRARGLERSLWTVYRALGGAPLPSVLPPDDGGPEEP
jgi:hypothetical protein